MMRRQNLRAANLHPNYSDNENIAGDSSLKKNTAMVSKLKSIDNTGRLAEELCKLKFDKFLTEMINSITGEAVLKVKSQADAIAIIEVCKDILWKRANHENCLGMLRITSAFAGIRRAVRR
jgi:hypothetical protein